MSVATSPIATEASLRPVRVWLYVIAVMVVAMVVIGGATRLTDSGLSITEWRPIAGAIPPLDAADWAVAFDKYRQTTEYQTINRGMSLGDFQFIYWWEWGHRQWGRLLGIAFAVPLAWFWATGRLTPWLKPRLVLLLLAGGLQGVIGWWMVRSGLVNRVDVSQYRLATHLTMASLIFAYALWLARSTLQRAPVAGPSWQAAGMTALVVSQIALGGLVAGMDAGLAWNTWPLMDGAIVPGGLWPSGELAHLFSDGKTVQFVHRMSAYLVWGAALAHLVHALVFVRGRYLAGAAVLFGLVTVQALIGIVTLVLQVPLVWALLHQVGAIVVLGAAILHWRAASALPRAIDTADARRAEPLSPGLRTA